MEEDQLTASFGALLGNDDELLSTFLKQVGIKLDSRNAKHVKIETQVQEQENRLDLTISLKNEFLVYIEVKITAGVTKHQLRKYLKQLATKKFKEKRLVLITLSRENEILRSAAAKTGFSRSKAVNLLWKDVLNALLAAKKTKGKEFLFNYFLERWKHTMEGEINPKEYKLEDLKEVLVVVEEPKCMDYIKRKGVLVPPGASVYQPAQFVAFYVSDPVKELKYLAQVRKIVYDVSGRKLPKGYYSANRVYPEVIYINPPIELTNRLTRGKQNMNIWGGRFTTLTKLLDARSKTLDDLLKARV